MSTKSLSLADEAARRILPEGWFRIGDLPSELLRPAYRCERLEKAGVLKSRVVGQFPSLHREYHKA